MMNGTFDVSQMILSTLARWMVAVCSSFVKSQIWQFMLRHSGAFLLAKSEGMLN